MESSRNFRVKSFYGRKLFLNDTLKSLYFDFPSSFFKCQWIHHQESPELGYISENNKIDIWNLYQIFTWVITNIGGTRNFDARGKLKNYAKKKKLHIFVEIPFPKN